MADASKLAEFVTKAESEVLAEWVAGLQANGTDIRISGAELNAQTAQLLRLLVQALPSGTNTEAPAWTPVRTFLEEVSSSRALQGFTAAETATFVFSLKRALFDRLRRTSSDAAGMAKATWEASEIVDALGMHTIKAFQRSREAIITRQQEELLELSTPVVKLWDGVLALPMIGTLDSARTQTVMESLLQKIVETGSGIAIIDITGVPTVDTLVAQHLIKTAAAIRLMGAECIISGIRPQIAQTIVHLGIELRGITTKATLADALSVALERAGLMVVPKTVVA